MFWKAQDVFGEDGNEDIDKRIIKRHHLLT